MMTLSAYMEEKAAKYRMEALGRMRVTLAGSPPNGFISLMCDYFGYKGEEPVASTTSTVPPPTTAAQPTSGTSGRQFVPSSLMPVDPSIFLDPPEFGSGGEGPSGTRGPKEQLLTPYQTCADGVKPSSEQKRWSRTGLAAEYLPPRDDDLYSCPLPQCNYKRQNIDTVCIHIRRHLNIAIQCPLLSQALLGLGGLVEAHKESTQGATNQYLSIMGKNSPLALRTFLKRVLRHIILQQKKKELDWKLPLHFQTLEIIQRSQITVLRWRLKRKHKYTSSDCKLAYFIYFFLCITAWM